MYKLQNFGELLQHIAELYPPDLSAFPRSRNGGPARHTGSLHFLKAKINSFDILCSLKSHLHAPTKESPHAPLVAFEQNFDECQAPVRRNGFFKDDVLTASNWDVSFWNPTKRWSHQPVAIDSTVWMQDDIQPI